MFKGSIVALITPFREESFDEAAYRSLIEWHLEQGTDGFVACGTTGESPVLSHDEHRHVVETCVAAAGGRAPVIAGTGSNSTAEAVALTQHAEKAGADAVLVVTPYYNKPGQEGLYLHFKAIHDASAVPIIIYNIPGRCVIDMSVETMARLAELPRIIGVKDATADLNRPIRTRAAIGSDFCQLSGEDATALPFLAAGGHGCISVSANVAPAACAQMQKAWRDGDVAAASRISDQLSTLHAAMFCESNPIPVKYAASLLGKCAPDVRLPLQPISVASKGTVEKAMRSAGLIN
ncbi:MAG TPA: 4-hydroxy-tetrahydrodipicolinate synthase [Rhodospirillales bacterium]|nr:4-hydroxy-tetrahydrodipicolinate synthase [Rhodospirillales bacterium]